MVPENTEATIMFTVKLGDKKCQWLLTHVDALHAKIYHWEMSVCRTVEPC